MPDRSFRAPRIRSGAVRAPERLSAVIDLPCAGVGDPACDLVVAWNLLPPSVRPAFRAAVGIDEATWRRGRARALSIAVVALPYYQESNPVFAAEARHTIREVLNEYAKGSTGRDQTRQ